MNFAAPLNTVEAKTGPSYTLVPPANYLFLCTNAVDKVSKNSGNPILELSFDIAHGQYQEAFNKYPIRFYIVNTAENLPRIKGNLMMFQVSNPSVTLDISMSNFDERSLIGLFVGGNIVHEEWNGKTRAKIEYLCNAVKLGYTIPNPVKISSNNQDDLPF
jgi:hypothetical protein